jgi:hypothetical protein
VDLIEFEDVKLVTFDFIDEIASKEVKRISTPQFVRFTEKI